MHLSRLINGHQMSFLLIWIWHFASKSTSLSFDYVCLAIYIFLSFLVFNHLSIFPWQMQLNYWKPNTKLIAFISWNAEISFSEKKKKYVFIPPRIDYLSAWKHYFLLQSMVGHWLKVKCGWNQEKVWKNSFHWFVWFVFLQ